MRFYLGTHMPHWLAIDLSALVAHAYGRVEEVPLFVSRTRLERRGQPGVLRATLPVAVNPWAMDSGGFTELQRFGGWTITPARYVANARRCRDEIGRLDWVAPMDWMCEDAVINGGQFGRLRFVGTHLSVAEHQARTVANLLELRGLAPDLPFVPVLQGQAIGDYLRCRDAYARAGIDLTREPIVGLGSVCRRQATEEIAAIAATLRADGIAGLHGFGVKSCGLALYGDDLASADSLAWSARGRHEPGCGPSHGSEANCLRFALRRREEILAAFAGPQQLSLLGVGALWDHLLGEVAGFDTPAQTHIRWPGQAGSLIGSLP